MIFVTYSKADATPVHDRATLLGYAGLMPFAAGVVISWFPALVGGLYEASALTRWAVVYGAVILSFMAGARWGLAVATGKDERLVEAVIPSLIGWLAVLPPLFWPEPEAARGWGIALLLLGFGMVLAGEYRTREWAPWYLSLRTRLSAGVAIFLVLILLAGWAQPDLVEAY